MIFVTVGTERWPFDRLIKTVDAAVERKAISDEVFAQVGTVTYVPEFMAFEKMLSFDKFIEMVKGARIIVSHAGAGSVILCLRLGKIPILFPRDASRAEHLDNHQMELARKMRDTGRVLVAYSEEDLLFQIDHYEELTAKMRSCKIVDDATALVAYLNSLCQKR